VTIVASRTPADFLPPACVIYGDGQVTLPPTTAA
jgi:hypothetical protein